MLEHYDSLKNEKNFTFGRDQKCLFLSIDQYSGFRGYTKVNSLAGQRYCRVKLYNFRRILFISQSNCVGQIPKFETVDRMVETLDFTGFLIPGFSEWGWWHWIPVGDADQGSLTFETHFPNFSES